MCAGFSWCDGFAVINLARLARYITRCFGGPSNNYAFSLFTWPDPLAPSTKGVLRVGTAIFGG